MLKVGVTGGIGSGKTTVCKIFECLGVPVFRADEEGRRLLTEDKDTQKKVIELFGRDILTADKLDRKKIAAVVFNDSEKLKQLNNIIHPAVRSAFNNWVAQQDAEIIIEEVAILFESGANKGLDSVIVVTAPEKTRIQRAMSRDNLVEAEVRKRMSSLLC
jgi:dephospho-CoA kinase